MLKNYVLDFFGLEGVFLVKKRTKHPAGKKLLNIAEIQIRFNVLLSLPIRAALGNETSTWKKNYVPRMVCGNQENFYSSRQPRTYDARKKRVSHKKSQP